MKVSWLCPSRNRPELLARSLVSLGTGDYELLVAIDKDEPQADEYLDISKDGRVRLYETPRYGYGQLHEYYNLLASKAHGDWIGLWNDDATMETANWLDIIAQYDHTKPVALNIWSDGMDNLFPLISRKWYEIVGHFSRNTHADSWVQQMGERLGNQIHVPGIQIIHQGENLHDQTHQEVRQVVRETSAKYRAMERERIEDANKIERWRHENHNNL